MWLTDHQMNKKVSEEFGEYYIRLPLTKSATIVNGNALTTDWSSIIDKSKLSYIIGNPPFVGSKIQSKKQREDLAKVFTGIKKAKVLDYVSAWYYLASQYVQGTKIKVAFVSTNSVVQGEQVGILWKDILINLNIKIHFAHRTFKWKNEAKRKRCGSLCYYWFCKL